MTSTANPTIVPTLRYLDANAAIDFLCEAFGFERHTVVPGENDTVAHAQLKCGNGMIMLGSAAVDDRFQTVQKTPNEVGGFATQSPYVVVPDIRAHYERAKAAGAQIVDDYSEKDYGGAGYSCIDPERNLWHFGDYDPFAEE